MKIVVSGGTGFIGRALVHSLLEDAHQVTVLSRKAHKARGAFDSRCSLVQWDAQHAGAWEQTLEGSDAVINLAGASIAERRWTEARKRVLWDSRIISTNLLVDAVARVSRPAKIFISASAIGYYGPRDDRLLDEQAESGQGFLADLCVAWEAAAMRAQAAGVRVVCPRFGMVLERDGGALPRMLFPFRAFLGGPIMPGTQWVSWIHREDLIRLISWTLSTPGINGPLNAVAPNPVPMSEFCRALGAALHRPSWLPVPELALRIALGELGSVLTTGQRVIPHVSHQQGFSFRYPTVDAALREIAAPYA